MRALPFLLPSKDGEPLQFGILFCCRSSEAASIVFGHLIENLSHDGEAKTLCEPSKLIVKDTFVLCQLPIRILIARLNTMRMNTFNIAIRNENHQLLEAFTVSGKPTPITCFNNQLPYGLTTLKFCIDTEYCQLSFATTMAIRDLITTLHKVEGDTPLFIVPAGLFKPSTAKTITCNTLYKTPDEASFKKAALHYLMHLLMQTQRALLHLLNRCAPEDRGDPEAKAFEATISKEKAQALLTAFFTETCCVLLRVSYKRDNTTFLSGCPRAFTSLFGHSIQFQVKTGKAGDITAEKASLGPLLKGINDANRKPEGKIAKHFQTTPAGSARKRSRR